MVKMMSASCSAVVAISMLVLRSMFVSDEVE